jgi:hypothetical protein
MNKENDIGKEKKHGRDKEKDREREEGKFYFGECKLRSEHRKSTKKKYKRILKWI